MIRQLNRDVYHPFPIKFQKFRKQDRVELVDGTRNPQCLTKREREKENFPRLVVKISCTRKNRKEKEEDDKELSCAKSFRETETQLRAKEREREREFNYE